MSNTPRKTCKPHRPSYCFIFQSPAEADKFFDFANQRQDTTIVQHPLSADGSGNRLKHQVLVTGTGSMLFDTNLKNELVALATTLGGCLMPK